MAKILMVFLFAVIINGVLSELSGPSLILRNHQDLVYLLVEEKQIRRQMEGTVSQLKQDVDFLKSQYQKMQSQYQDLQLQHQRLIMDQNQTSNSGANNIETQPGHDTTSDQQDNTVSNRNTSLNGLSVAATEITKIRLVGSPSPYMGRVEVFYNGSWGFVCDDQWDENDAKVVCKMLGYSTSSPYSSVHFGRSSGKMWSENVQCDGSESSLSYCKHLTADNNNCTNQMDAGVICGTIRLADGPDPFSGRVEIYHDGQWGTICNKEFDVKEARVVCSMLGLTGGTTYNPFGGRGMIWMDYVHCNGQEVSITECPHNGWGLHDCNHTEDVGVRCSNVRLVNGIASNKGRVEIFHEGQWGTICDDEWNNNAAVVVCKMLGYRNGTAFANAHFGRGSSKIWLDNINCRGNESDLAQCQRSAWGNHNCHHKEDASVACDLNPIDMIRIVDGQTVKKGRVEIFHSGQWGTICDDHWNNNVAAVACRMAGYSGGTATSEAHYGQGHGPIWLNGFGCNGAENSLFDCGDLKWNVGNCRHREDAGVECS